MPIRGGWQSRKVTWNFYITVFLLVLVDFALVDEAGEDYQPRTAIGGTLWSGVCSALTD